LIDVASAKADPYKVLIGLSNPCVVPLASDIKILSPSRSWRSMNSFWTRLSCRTFAANAVRLQLHALAYNLGNFLRTLARPEPIKEWSLTSLKEMPAKMARSALLQPFGMPVEAAVVRAANPTCQNIGNSPKFATVRRKS
jgi:hypothetical protein